VTVTAAADLRPDSFASDELSYAFAVLRAESPVLAGDDRE
jgi:hypothetical protein